MEQRNAPSDWRRDDVDIHYHRYAHIIWRDDTVNVFYPEWLFQFWLQNHYEEWYSLNVTTKFLSLLPEIWSMIVHNFHLLIQPLLFKLSEATPSKLKTARIDYCERIRFFQNCQSKNDVALFDLLANGFCHYCREDKIEMFYNVTHRLANQC